LYRHWGSVQAVGPIGGVEVQLYCFFNLGARWGWVVNARPLYPRERPGTHCTGGWVGPGAGLDSCGKISPPPGFDPLTVQPVVSRYTDWATRPFIFRLSEVSLKSDKNYGYVTWRPVYIYVNISLNYSWNEKCFRQSRREIKAHILLSVTFFRKSCRLWDDVESYCRSGQATDDNITRRMRIACCITEVTNAHSKHITLIAFPLQQWLHRHSSMLRHTCIAFLVVSEL